MNTYIRKIRKNSKALSPVVASIILIAVTVAVSVVVAAWMGGMTIGLMGNAEQVSVSNAVFTSNTVATLTVRNTGGATVTLDSATVDGASAVLAGPTNNAIAKGGAEDFTVTLSGTATFAPGAQYEIRLITAKGTTVVYSATYNPIV
jgi:archaeal type IV pilus assembly protein PilA